MSWIMPESALTNSLAIYMLVAIAATLLIGFSKGGFGGGVGVLATPLLMLVLPGNVTISLILPILIVCDIFTLIHFPKHWDKRSYKLLLSGTFLGYIAGMAFLVCLVGKGDSAQTGEKWIRIVVGVVALLFCLIKVLEPVWKKTLKSVGESQKPFRTGLKMGMFMGLLAGFTTMVAHAAGSIVTMFLLPQRMDPKTFVGTCGRYFFTVNVSKVPLFILASHLAERDFITLDTLKWGLWLIPFCPIGVALGAWLNHRLSGKIFTIIIYLLLFLTGLKMIQSVL